MKLPNHKSSSIDKRVKELTRPNPGSQEAQDLGCICPIMDNEYGNEELTGGAFYVTKGCPVHPWITRPKKEEK